MQFIGRSIILGNQSNFSKLYFHKYLKIKEKLKLKIFRPILKWSLGWGNGASIPDFLCPCPQILGTGGYMDKVWKNFGDFSGTGMGLILSFFGVLSPKIPQKRGWGRG